MAHFQQPSFLFIVDEHCVQMLSRFEGGGKYLPDFLNYYRPVIGATIDGKSY